MANQLVTPEMSQWLAHLQMAFAWTKEPGGPEAIDAGFAAGSLEKMPDREKYDALIARYDREKKAVETRGKLAQAKEMMARRRRWG